MAGSVAGGSQSDREVAPGRLLRSLGQQAPESLEDRPELIPWLSFLPAQQRQLFITEFFRTAEAAAELGAMTPLAQLLREWQATGVIYADPELAAELRRPLAGDGDRVPAPAAE